MQQFYAYLDGDQREILEHMRHLKYISAWIPVSCGLLLVALTARYSLVSCLLASVPALFIITGGGRCLSSPDMRGAQDTAIGVVLGVILLPPVWWFTEFSLALTMLVLLAAAFVASGWLQIRMQPVLDEVPAPAPNPLYSLQVALDNVFLGPLSALTWIPATEELRSDVQESVLAYEMFSERGWLDNPASFHPQPPALDSVDISPICLHGVDCEWLRFDSGFEPSPGIPGRDRWLSYRNNRTAHALLLRQAPDGPWLLCVAGFGMGSFKQDFQAFRVQQIHRNMGLNVALLTLPVHGKRSDGGFSGARFIGHSPLDFIHAEAQAIWDLRRLIRWIYQQGDARIGVHGISLGGYTCAVLAGLEDNLACVIAGVPPTDILAIHQRLSSHVEKRVAIAVGADFSRDCAIQRVVSPLCLTPGADVNRRFIYAATGDQFVPIEQTLALWHHWQRPKISWCTGAHVSALMQREPAILVRDALQSSFGLAGVKS